ncbi:hypothetical protein ANOM_010352, partial [Aspergillus nomiae NRRL 13137]
LRTSRQKSCASVTFHRSHTIIGFCSIVSSCCIHIIARFLPFQMDIDMSRRNKKPRLLLESERERLEEFIDSIHYSARYSDDQFEYRHVQLPKNMLKKIPADYFDSSKGTLKLLWEEEWRALGITQVAWVGSTTRFMSRNRIFCYSSVPSTTSHQCHSKYTSSSMVNI